MVQEAGQEERPRFGFGSWFARVQRDRHAVINDAVNEDVAIQHSEGVPDGTSSPSSGRTIRHSDGAPVRVLNWFEQTFPKKVQAWEDTERHG